MFLLDNDCGFVVAEDDNSARSSIERLCEHQMVPSDVYDAQYPAFRPSGGPEIDETIAASPHLMVGLEPLGAAVETRRRSVSVPARR